MNLFFGVLLVLTVAVSVALLLTLIPARKPALRGRGTVRLVGLGQLTIGGLWIGFGVAFLAQHGIHDGRGWYAVVLGALWAWQALRRLLLAARGRSRPRA